MITFLMVDTDFDYESVPFGSGFEADCKGEYFDIWLCYTGLGRTKKVVRGAFSHLTEITSEQFNEQLEKMRKPDFDIMGRYDVRTFIMQVEYAYRTALDLRLRRDMPWYRVMQIDAKEAEMWSLIDAMQILEKKEVKNEKGKEH